MGTRLDSILAAFMQQDYPMELVQIIVVDNGSTDNAIEIAAKYPVTVMQIPKPHNPYVCRNRGMQQAQYDWILLSDASCLPDVNYLREFVNAQTTHQADIFVGNVQFDVNRQSSLGEITDSLHFMRNDEYADVRKTYPGCSMFFHRSVLDRTGYFREDMRSGADFELTIKACTLGLRIQYVDKARVMRQGIPFPRLFRKAHRLGWGHGTMARASGNYTIIGTIWRMRPPGVRYMAYVLKTRGQGVFDGQWFRAWVGLWIFRFYYNLGRLHLAQSFSD